MKFAVVVPWHNPDQRDLFLQAWGIKNVPDWLFLQRDEGWESCAKTKNIGIETALQWGAEVIVVIDDDCYPELDYPNWKHETTEGLVEAHLEALKPQPVELYEAVTDPPSRGTPCFNRTLELPVAASMGFWTGAPDLDAASSLRHDFSRPIEFKLKAMFGRFFPFSGMNCAFKAEFWPFFKFEEGVGRMDDIFMGYRLQAEAYRRGYCINLNGPLVRHSRQSNVWANLRSEAEFMERNETEWIKHAQTLLGP